MTTGDAMACTYWVHQFCPQSLNDPQHDRELDRTLGTFQASLMLWQEQYGYGSTELNMRLPMLVLADKRERMLYKLTWG